MPLSLTEVASDLGDLIDLISAVEAMIAAESGSHSMVERIKAAEPVLEKLAALADKVKAQAAS